MMIAANVPEEMKYKLFREKFTCATILEWPTIVQINGLITTRVEYWCGELPRWEKALRTWGESGVVKIATTTSVKGKPRGNACLFVGYALGHATGVYRMWNPNTNRVLETRDVTWLKRMYYRKPQPVCKIILREENNDEARESIDERSPLEEIDPGESKE